MNWKQLGSGAVFAFGMLCLGFSTGGVIGSRMTSPGGMGGIDWRTCSVV